MLKFFPAGKMTGFRASGLSAYNNVDPHTVVRELVQNSLDAATTAKRDVVRVAFELEDLRSSRIPARAAYKEHFNSAVETQRKKDNLKQAEPIVDAMQASIDARQVPALWVLDNGIGLNVKGMEDLLGDGQSGKADESTAGSYGNGHMTSFPASDLRYVLYGGVHKGGRTASGHAILATHSHGRAIYGEDGYIAEQVRSDDLFQRFVFPDGSSIPVLREKLDWIEGEFGIGSAVGILGFNYFNRFESDEEVLGAIEIVVATHFAPLIREGRMVVDLWISGDLQRAVDADALPGILEKRQERVRRDRNSIGPSGRQAWDALLTLAPEYRQDIETAFGTVHVHLRQLERGGGGGTHLQLFRNGMWITNDVPHNKASDFRQVVPFSGVILLDPTDAKDACTLVGNFEGPRHIDIDLTRQRRGSSQRRALDRFLGELHDRILELIPDLESEQYDPEFFSIEVLGEGARTSPRARAPGVGTPERAPRRQSRVRRSGVRKKKRSRRKKGTRRARQTPYIDTRVSAIKDADGVRLRVKALQDVRNAELWVVLPGGADETCDNPTPDAHLELGKGVEVNGRSVEEYVRDEKGNRRAVMLGAVSAQDGEIDVWIPSRRMGPGEIRVDLFERDQLDAGAEG